MANFQREGAVSNAHVGREFEERAKTVLTRHGLDLDPNHKVAVGIGVIKEGARIRFGRRVSESLSRM